MLLEHAHLDQGTICVADQRYGVLILEQEPDEATAVFLKDFRNAGGTILNYGLYAGDEAAYLSDIRCASLTLTCLDSHKDLRLTRVRKYGVDILFLSN